MASKLIQFRLSGEQLEALEAQVREGDSINLVAQQILIGALGVDTVDDVSTPDLDERIEGIVEERISAFSTNCNNLFDRLQESIQSLQERIQTLETQTIARPPTNPVEDKPMVDGTVDNTVDSVDLTLTGKELSRRLEVHPATITKNRTKPTFTDWTRSRDPEGKAWQYLPEAERYSPVLYTEVSTESTEDDNLAGWKAQVDAVVGALL
jgi:hypothetical protein